MKWKEVLSTLLPLFLLQRKLVWTSFSLIRTSLGVPQFHTFHYSGHGAYCMKYMSCAKWAAARMENEQVTAVTLDLYHVLDFNISLGHSLRYSSSLQWCNVVTSRFRNKQQMLRKRRTSVIGSSDLVGSRFCCTWTWKCCRKSEVADLWTGLLCWSLGTAREAYERFRWHRERGRTYMHRSRSGTPPARTNERVITRHISIERMDSGACVRK